MRNKLSNALRKIAMLALGLASFILLPSRSHGDLENGGEGRVGEAGWIYEQAEAKFAARSYSDASFLYRWFLLTGEGSERKWASFKLGLSYERAGDYSQAVEAYREALNEYPALTDYIVYRLGISHMGLGEYGKAVESFQSVISTYGGSTTLIPYCYEMMAESYRKMGHYESAVEAYRKVVKINSVYFDIPGIRMKIAGLYEEASQPKEAVDVYRQVVELHPNRDYALAAINRIDILIREHPEIGYSPSSDDKYRRYYSLYLNGRYKDSIAGFSELVAEGKALPSLYWRGRAYLAQRSYQEAINDFIRVYTLYKDDPLAEDARYYLALSYEGREDYDMALASYEEVVARYPSGRWAVEAIAHRAAHYEVGGKLEAAAGEYKRICLGYPDNAQAPDSCFRSAINYYRVGRYEEAGAILEGAIAKYPDYDLSGGIAYWAGKSYFRIGLLSRAIAFYRLVVFNYPYDYYAIRAREQLAELDTLYPLQADNLYQQGLRDYDSGLYDDAAEAFYRVMLLYPYGRYDRKDIVERMKASAELSAQQGGGYEGPAYFRLFSFHPKAPNLPTPYVRDRYHKGNDLIDIGLYADGLREMREALSYRSDDVYDLYGLAIAHYRSGKYRDAINISTRILSRIYGKRYLLIYPRQLRELLYPMPYKEMINYNSHRHGLDFYLMNALIREESKFDSDDVSRSGAIGLMQIIPSTGRWISRNISPSSYRAEDLFEPEVNIRMGSWYMAYLLKLFDGDLTLALAGYNAGQGNVQRWLKANEMKDKDLFIESFPFRETRGFIKKVYRNYEDYKYFYESDEENM